MKNVIFFILICFVSQGAIAQLERSVWQTGGVADFYSYNQNYESENISNEGKFTQITLSGNIGYFVMDKFAIGLKPGFSSIKGKTTNAGGLTTNLQRYLIGPYARYYLVNLESRYNIVTEASYQWGFIGGGKNSGSMNDATILVGPVIYFSSSVGLEFLGGYKYRTEKINDINGNHYLNDMKNGFFMAIGLQIHLQNDN